MYATELNVVLLFPGLTYTWQAVTVVKMTKWPFTDDTVYCQLYVLIFQVKVKKSSYRPGVS